MVNSFVELPAKEFGFEKFSNSSEELSSNFFFIYACLMVSTSNIPKYL